MGLVALGRDSGRAQAGDRPPEGADVRLLNRFLLLRTRLEREEGQTIIEYALVIGGVSLVLIIAFVESGLLDEFDQLVDALTPLLGG
jgi:Flp pilus assembly pilin Flp